MGWFYRMSFHVARPLSKAIQELKQLGVCLYVAENQFSQPVAPHQPHGDRKWALVIGSEFSGVSEEIVQECDQKSLRSAATGTFPKRCTCLLHLFV